MRPLSSYVKNPSGLLWLRGIPMTKVQCLSAISWVIFEIFKYSAALAALISNFSFFASIGVHFLWFGPLVEMWLNIWADVVGLWCLINIKSLPVFQAVVMRLWFQEMSLSHWAELYRIHTVVFMLHQSTDTTLCLWVTHVGLSLSLWKKWCSEKKSFTWHQPALEKQKFTSCCQHQSIKT